MSDESNTPEESQPQGEPFEAEPEGGPSEREREFLQERITRTRSRSEAGLIAGTEPATIPIPLEPELQDEAARFRACGRGSSGRRYHEAPQN